MTSPYFVLGRPQPSPYTHVRLGLRPPSGLVWLAIWPGTLRGEKWRADGGDPNFILTFARLPETLARFVAFYSPLVRKGTVEHRTKELARLRLAQLNECRY